MSQPPPLHPDLAPVAWLLGTWRGEGTGFYPTVEDFSYLEEATWGHAGKPLLAYASATRATDDGRPLHAERGFLRVAGGQAELVIAHANGHVEIAVGPLGDPLVLRSVQVIDTPAAKPVSALDRRLWTDGGELRYALGMEAVGQQHLPHLQAVLRRVDPCA